MNFVIVTGNVVNDPDAFTTQSGISRSSFKVAVQRRFKNAQGTYDADFLPIVVWRGAAEFCNKYVRKGRKVAIEGSIQTRSYDAQDGSKRYVTEIIADNVELLDKAENGGQARPQAKPQGKQANTTPDGFVEVEDDDGLPF